MDILERLYTFANENPAQIAHLDGEFDSFMEKVNELVAFANDYEEGSFTLTGVGFSGTAPAVTARWVRIGKMVTLHIPGFTGTSNTAGLSLSGIPTAIRPARTQENIWPGVYNGGFEAYGKIDVKTDGTADVWWFDSQQSELTGIFESSGSKGILGGVHHYQLG